MATTAVAVAVVAVPQARLTSVAITWSLLAHMWPGRDYSTLELYNCRYRDNQKLSAGKIIIEVIVIGLREWL